MTVISVRDGDRLIGAVVELDEAPAPESATGTRRRHARHSVATSIGLPGTSPKWVAALEKASRYARDRMHVVVTGEPGVGKWTLVQEMIGAQGAADRCLTVDCRYLVGAEDFAQELPALTAEVLVLRHLDALSDAAARTLGNWIDGVAGEASPWILATCTGDDELGLAPGLLVERFRGVVLRLPALHERPDDIQAVVVDLVARHSRGRDVRLAPDAVRALARTSWPATSASSKT